MPYIDVHCHINDTDYPSVPQLMEELLSCNVQKIICAGFDLASSRYALALSQTYQGCYFTAGIHPTECSKMGEDDLKRIEELFAHPKCVAVGEIGLDYHYEDTDKPLQHAMFRKQLQLAIQHKLPVQIHSRDSAEDTFAILQEYAHDLVGISLHCYSYSPEMAQRFLSLGCTFSFGGTSTYKRSKKPRRTIVDLPLESLMTETDSPYLAPASLFGIFPNTPKSIPEVCRSMADLKGLTEEEMAKTVWQNAHAFFPKLADQK